MPWCTYPRNSATLIIGSAIGYRPIFNNLIIRIGISMTDKQTLVVSMRITRLVQVVHCWLYCLASWLTLGLGRSRLSGNTSWWEKIPSLRYVGSVSNPFCVVGVTQRHNTTNPVQHLKAKHSEHMSNLRRHWREERRAKARKRQFCGRYHHLRPVSEFGYGI